MPTKIDRYSRSPFTDRAPTIALGALGLLVVAAIVPSFFSRKLLNEILVVPAEETVKLNPIQPRQSPIGAVRIDVTARLPNNTWITFEVQVLDSQGNLLASAIKQSWRESGTWYEDGESGSWSEQDLDGRFDIRRATLNEPMTIAISALEQGRTSGQPFNEPITFRVAVWDGAIDGRFLWSGIIVVPILIWLAVLAVKNSGEVVISKSIDDSDLSERSRVGGADTLVRVTIEVIADETSPRVLNAELFVKDVEGNIVYRRQLLMPLTRLYKNGRCTRTVGQCTLDLVLEPEGSYGFFVEIVPDAPVDRTSLKVKQGVRTLKSTEVIHLTTSTD